MSAVFKCSQLAGITSAPGYAENFQEMVGGLKTPLMLDALELLARAQTSLPMFGYDLDVDGQRTSGAVRAACLSDAVIAVAERLAELEAADTNEDYDFDSVVVTINRRK